MTDSQQAHTGETGTAVFAVASTSADEVRLYGFGLYVGDRRRPGTVPFADLGESEKEMYRSVIRNTDAYHIDPIAFYEAERVAGRMTRQEADEARAAGHKRHAAQLARPLDDRASDLHERCALNPLIVLDNGDEVWGCECWWGPIDQWEKVSQGRTVIEVSIAEHRAAAGIEAGRDLAVPAVLSGSSEAGEVGS